MIFFFPALGGLLFGYDIGATSAVLTQLQSSKYSGVSWYSVVDDSATLQGFIASMGMAGAVIGSVITFQVADILGRRRELLMVRINLTRERLLSSKPFQAAVLFCVGSVVEVIAGANAWSAPVAISVLLLGRAIYGVACAFAMHGVV